MKTTTPQAEHTPGPWFYAASAHEDADYIVGSAWPDPRGEGYNPQVALIRNSQSALSNARLIAAAPDLVAALERLTSDVECYCADNVADNRPCGHCVARAALAKAKGGTK
jgi:hypothetical protein